MCSHHNKDWTRGGGGGGGEMVIPSDVALEYLLGFTQTTSGLGFCCFNFCC